MSKWRFVDLHHGQTVAILRSESITPEDNPVECLDFWVACDMEDPDKVMFAFELGKAVFLTDEAFEVNFAETTLQIKKELAGHRTMWYLQNESHSQLESEVLNADCMDVRWGQYRDYGQYKKRPATFVSARFNLEGIDEVIAALKWRNGQREADNAKRLKR